MSESERRRLGRILVQKGVISEFQLHHALAYQRVDGRPLGDVLVHLKLATEEQIRRALSEQPSTRTQLDAAVAVRERELDEREAALRELERQLAERARRLALREAEVALEECEAERALG